MTLVFLEIRSLFGSLVADPNIGFDIDTMIVLDGNVLHAPNKLIKIPNIERFPMPHPPSIILRTFHEADTEFFASMAADERVTHYIGDGQPWDQQPIQTRVRAALQQGPIDAIGASRWFLATEATEPVGIVVSTRKETGIEIGYWVSPEHWGRGIAGAMLDSTLTRIPEVYAAKTLIARVDPANAASIRLLTRHGFQLESHDQGLDLYMLN